MCDILISIKPRHVENILSGKKTVEIRRRTPRIPKGTNVWVYSTLPDGHVRLVATVKKIEESEPSEIWRNNSGKVAITQTEYEVYVNERTKVCAIHFSNVRKLFSPVSLDQLRSIQRDFAPPQFFRFLDKDSSLLNGLIRNAPNYPPEFKEKSFNVMRLQFNCNETPL